MTSKIKSFIMWGVRLGATVYLGQQLSSGTLDGNITDILVGTGWGLTEVVNVGIAMLGKYIPIATLNSFLGSFKKKVGKENYDVAMNAIKGLDFNGLIQTVNTYTEGIGLDIKDVLVMQKANMLVAYDNGLYDDHPELKEQIETILNK